MGIYSFDTVFIESCIRLIRVCTVLRATLVDSPCSRSYFRGTAFRCSSECFKAWNDFIYRFRSYVFFRFFLGFFS